MVCVKDIKVKYILSRDPTVLDRTINYYYPTHMRAFPWLIGLLAGYYLRILNLKEIKINKVCNGFGTILNSCLM